jgi:tetratricopeptide (TPR) repeat protein
LSDHPSRNDLAALLGGDLSPEREREVMGHLLLCKPCFAEAPPPVRLLLGSDPARRERTGEEAAGYGTAVSRAMATALKHRRHLRREQVQARKILTLLEDGGIEAVQKIPRSLSPLARMNAFLAWSWRLRHEDPPQMVQFALYAAQVSRQLDVRQYGLERVFDFQASARGELGNAYRVADRLHEADETLGRARELFERGTRDKILEVRLLELEASLAADRRQFGRASEKLREVLRFHSQQGDRHFAGRTLVLLGLYAGYSGDHDKGIDLLKKGLLLVDDQRDPGLVCAAAHNLILFLVDSGRFQEARKLRLVHSPHLLVAGGRVNEIKFRALEGRIDAGLGKHARAEDIFREVRFGYESVGRHYHAAIAALDLAAALLSQGKSEEAMSVVLEAAETFIQLQIQREVLQAVILLRDAFRMETATLEMVEEVASFLRRTQLEPALRFEGQAWEDPDR